MDAEPIVFVISGDSKGRRSLSVRLKHLGYERRLCHSPEEFQQTSSPNDAGCILLHLDHTEIDLEPLVTLGPHESSWPVIAIAAAADLDAAVQAMKAGAFDFLLEASGDQRLRAAIDEAFRWDALRRAHTAHVQSIRRRLIQLDPAHRDVLDLLIKGKSNREMADELRLSVRSIEVRRAKVMKTMKARTLAVLVRQTLMVHGVGPSRPSLAPAGDLQTRGESSAKRLAQTTAYDRNREPSPRSELPQQYGQNDEQPRRAR